MFSMALSANQIGLLDGDHGIMTMLRSTEFSAESRPFFIASR
jgi:hypothetical protein